ncbi:MAG: GMC family oxidoreductase [Alphaproteobacteria bacterium]|nr:GMC family oxidoreductase [Alphaproteobacteria bacterium]
MSTQDAFDDEVASVTFDHADSSVVVIVGSGAGGGTLANELAQKGVDVVVLEAGPRFKATDFANDEHAAYEMLAWRDKRLCTGSSPIAQHFATSPTLTCKGVGGTTLHWAAMTPRFQAHEFKTRSVYGTIPGANIMDWPLSLEELAPYYDRAEDRMGVSGRHGLPMAPEINNFKVLKAGARRIGYTGIDTNNLAINIQPRDGRNGCDQIGFCQQGCKSGAKWATFNVELPRAEATGHCEVRPNAMALRVEHDAEGRVSGVLYADRAGGRHVQKARAVCVAGNAIESPRLLLNSASAKFPDGLANSSGQVGKNYMRHMFGFVYAQFDRPVNMHRGLTVAGIVRDEARHDPKRGFVGGFYFLISSLGLPYFGAFLNPGAWGRDYTDWIEGYNRTASLCALGEDMALETNRVSLHATEKDQHGLPIPVLHLDDHPNEFAMKNYAYKRSAELYDAVGARRIFEGPPLPASHNLGTCRMSEKPRDGVVNKWGQSHDVPNLFVSDGSQFTSSMAGNPTLTIVALALRQAEYIAEKLRGNEL